MKGILKRKKSKQLSQILKKVRKVEKADEINIVTAYWSSPERYVGGKNG